MSSSSINSRPMLKAKRRNNNFGGPSTKQQQQKRSPEKIVRQGIKRTNEQGDGMFHPNKKFCSKNSPKKNLANQRLQNLRKSLNEDRLNKSGNVSNSPRSNYNKSVNVEENHEYKIRKTPEKINLANERLNQVRQSLTPKIILSYPRINGEKNDLPVTETLASASTRLLNIRKSTSNQRLDFKENGEGDGTGPSCSKHDMVQEGLVGPSTPKRSKTDNLFTTENNFTNYLINNEIDRKELTTSWLNNNDPVIEFNNERGSSVCVNVNDSVADLYKLNSHDRSSDMEWNSSFQNIQNNDKKMIEKPNNVYDVEKSKVKNLCVVVDTNIFLSHLNKLEDILDLKMQGGYKPLIYIPWMVLVELDYIKDQSPNQKLKKSANSAIKFISKYLKSQDKGDQTRVIGQTVLEASQQQTIGPSPDDKIIACCLQALEKYENIMLLSNDVNLKNKAMVNQIFACSASEVTMKIVTKSRKNINSLKILTKMATMCTNVIKECAKMKFGDKWNQMDMLKHDPWTLINCMRIFTKYWSSVFKGVLLKQCQMTVEQLLSFLSKNNFICDDSEDFSILRKLCTSLCIFLKDITKCQSIVEKTLTEMYELP